MRKIASAKRVYLVAAAVAEQPRNTSTPFPETLVVKPAALGELTKAVSKWNRFEIVSEVEKAELVLLVTEWEDHHKWGNTIVCRDQLFVFGGGTMPNQTSQAWWGRDPEKWGKWGGCSGAGEPVKELRKEIEKADKLTR
jgi:hypothetical protein